MDYEGYTVYKYEQETLNLHYVHHEILKRISDYDVGISDHRRMYE